LGVSAVQTVACAEYRGLARRLPGKSRGLPGPVPPGNPRKSVLQCERFDTGTPSIPRDSETSREGVERPLTHHQLHELLESEQARSIVEGAEERGFIEPTELEAFALEHDLSDDDVEQLARELEALGLEIGPPSTAEAEQQVVQARPTPA